MSAAPRRLQEAGHWRLPPVVSLHLKRVSFSVGTAHKTQAQETFLLRDLDLSQLAIGPHPDTHSMMYDLYGVVEHHGIRHRGYCIHRLVPTASTSPLLADSSSMTVWSRRQRARRHRLPVLSQR